MQVYKNYSVRGRYLVFTLNSPHPDALCSEPASYSLPKGIESKGFCSYGTEGFGFCSESGVYWDECDIKTMKVGDKYLPAFWHPVKNNKIYMFKEVQ